MKKIIATTLICAGLSIVHAQNYIGGSMGVYGPQYNAATKIAAGGSVWVGNGGNWYFAGKVSSADKANPNAPTANGRKEIITFSGNGTYSGAALVDGYAAATGQASIFSLPIGDATTAYPVAAPISATVTAAYFDGMGSSRTMTINGSNATVYSPYFDLPTGITTGKYSFSYPAGFKNVPTSTLLTSSNTSANGTTGNTTYSLLANLPTFQSTAGSATADLSAVGATQTYFGSSTVLLPVTIVSFTALANGCTANLAWKSESESNSNNYVIEMSLDGTSFTPVGTIASKNSSTGATYNFAYDKLSNSVTYFKLKAVDNDGTFTYSQVVAVTGNGSCSGSLVVKIWPNPTNDIVNIEGLVNGTHIVLVNMNGQKLAETTNNGSTQTISLSSYPSGVYLLHIQGIDGSVNNIKVVRK